MKDGASSVGIFTKEKVEVYDNKKQSNAIFDRTL